MAEVGILKPNERVELIEGDIIVMPPIGPEHADNVDEFNEVLARYAPQSLPRPNPEPSQAQRRIRTGTGCCLAAPKRPEGYGAAHPTPTDVLVGHRGGDTVAWNMTGSIKAHIYGRSGVPETWVRNLPEDCIERFTEPGPDGYAQHTIHVVEKI